MGKFSQHAFIVTKFRQVSVCYNIYTYIHALVDHAHMVDGLANDRRSDQ